MGAPAEVSKRRSNVRIRQFKEKRHFNIAANLTLNTMVSFVILLIAHTADIHTHTRDNYCNPLCAARQVLIWCSGLLYGIGRYSSSHETCSLHDLYVLNKRSENRC